MTKEKLLSLSDKDLLDLAYLHGIVLDKTDNLGLDLKEELVEDILDDFESFAKNSSLYSSLKRYEFTSDSRSTDSSNYKFSFPESYGENALYAVLRDPFWIFVNWEIEVNTYLVASQDKGFSGFFIRVSSFDKHNKLIETNDLSINGMTGFSFVQLFHPETSHRVALFADINGLEAMIVTSSLIEGASILT